MVKKTMEKERFRSMSVAALWLLVLVVAGIFALSDAIDDKCAACRAVAGELEFELSKEKPRNHLDMRHRLDSKGQRQGKLIDYRVSELRVVELLDDLCDKMQDYTLKDDTNEWYKVVSWELLSNKQEAKAYAKDISTYCGRLLEETEDEFAELIKKGSVKVGEVSKVLCQDLSKHCSQRSISEKGEDNGNGEL
ncbi:hypothetical protein HN51_017951 [Arachis hypogaea]|uniref:DUF3456 domain-containing protein n=2 Tax=Arachis TaxID=3817 RepID=A0A445BRQ6_ARAHY|nr:uncharacterized protein LOC107460233 [Arachis duranensis]XP_025612431.1 protein seele [Arachis hypogaea]RYR41369.1 hypothetical protein Ahy_A08g037767 isoform B [Arachis hypogaea]